MERQKVRSSNICSVGYDLNLNILEIEFLDGGIYQYYGVSENVYSSLMSAGSHGSYFSSFIKDKYNCRKIY